ncbi:PKD-like domain-containing protein [Proteiniphilum sp.]|uniref:PKD-like domain-containing protein n=1 Tax=Proteiniphilum sp. TaxID=1926877 RepID=UPI002B21791B|nr:PKD-like domain-containing protein [Proteiniphilum sp.]MEA4918295.1 PKD-like domain-containing protein [Proteiniphilum sp.]
MVPPIISGLDSEYLVAVNEELKLIPIITNDKDVTYSWIFNQKEVANTKAYRFKAPSTPGNYNLRLKVTNERGVDEQSISVTVAFLTRISTGICTLLQLDTSGKFSGKNNITWTVLKSFDNLYRLAYTHTEKPIFTSAQTGEYIVKASKAELEHLFLITVNDMPTQTPYISQVFDFLPAPGQFVNELPRYAKGDTHKDMVRKAGESLIGRDANMVSLGGWGGYVTFGFDHTIVNVPDRRDFRISGNAFAASSNPDPKASFGGSCEPGIVMVAYDKNKNGKPDEDEWYEIKGSANFTVEKETWYPKAVDNKNDTNTIRDYEMTYYRPKFETPEQAGEIDNPDSFVTIQNYIRWTNNKGQEGYKVKNVYHSQSYYPAWITDDQLTYRGIRLAQNGIDESNSGSYYVLYAFGYGYVDNYPNTHDNSGIDIDWAIDKQGKKADLPGIDFVKVYNGIDQENGWLGECSTEVGRGEDLHLLGINIGTINK